MVRGKSGKRRIRKISKKIFPDLKIAMIHGKMTAKEKQKIMKLDSLKT